MENEANSNQKNAGEASNTRQSRFLEERILPEINCVISYDKGKLIKGT